MRKPSRDPRHHAQPKGQMCKAAAGEVAEAITLMETGQHGMALFKLRALLTRYDYPVPIVVVDTREPRRPQR